MQPVAAYSDNDFNPKEGTRRFVYSMPGESYLVVKIFTTVDGEKYTVKIWDGTLDYQRTVRSWRTKFKFSPSADEYRKYFRVACRMLENAGFRASAIVIARNL